jgi:uncharacterized protein YhaN
MKTIEVFLSVNHKLPESRMVDDYKEALDDAENAGMRLSRFLRVKDGKPAYSDGVEVVASEIDRASNRLEQVKTDIREYLACLGDDYDSITQMIETANRHRRSLDNVDRDAKNLLERAIKASGLPPERAQDAPEVQAALDKRDRLHQELEPVIRDLSDRINRTKKVIGRY